MTIAMQVLTAKGGGPFTIGPERMVFDAIKEMEERDIGALVVVDQGSAVGMVTERDYARKVVLEGRSSRDTTVRDVMSELTCVHPGSNLELCMALMTTRRVRHLAVMNEGRLLGVISIGDAVKAIIDEQKFTIDQLERYITGCA